MLKIYKRLLHSIERYFGDQLIGKKLGKKLGKNCKDLNIKCFSIENIEIIESYVNNCYEKAIQPIY